MFTKNYVRHLRLKSLLAGWFILLGLALIPLPAQASVGLIYFGALPGYNAGEVIVQWETETETDIVGFRVKRSTQPLVQTAISVAIVQNQGSATTGAAYQITDTGLAAGQTYYYWLMAITSSGTDYVLTQAVPVVAPGGTLQERRYYLPVAPHSL